MTMLRPLLFASCLGAAAVALGFGTSSAQTVAPIRPAVKPLPSAAAATSPETQSSTSSRAYAAGNYVMDIGGKNVGYLKSFKGGNPMAEVVTEKPTPAQPYPKKHVGQVQYEPIVVSVSASMSKELYTELEKAFNGQLHRFNGAVHSLDYQFKEASRLSYTDGYISEVVVPGLDIGGKDPIWFKVRLVPGYTKTESGSGTAYKADYKVEQKMMLPSNFRLSIAGLEAATQKVTTIEPITVKQKPAESSTGSGRDSAKGAPEVSHSNLVVTLPTADAAPFVAWLNSFVVQGNNDESQEKEGTLELLSPNRKNVLVLLTFKNIGIFRLTSLPTDSSSTTPLVKAEMYVEHIVFSYKG
jgi:hypothetical protein